MKEMIRNWGIGALALLLCLIGIGWGGTIAYADDPAAPSGPTPPQVELWLEGTALDPDDPNQSLIRVEYTTDNGNTWTTMTGDHQEFQSVPVTIRLTYDSGKVEVSDGTRPGSQKILPNGGRLVSGSEYTISTAGTYAIQADKIVRTVVWAYDDTYGEDGKIKNGTVEILSAVKPGETGRWSGLEVPMIPEENMNRQDDRGGRVVIIPGSVVTVKLIPAYGYQFVAGALNGTEITAGKEVSTFTFVMPDTNLHLSALFTKSADQTAVTAKGISGAGVTGGEQVITSGNLKLTVADSTLSDAEKAKMLAGTTGDAVTAVNWVEVDLEQVVNKGNVTDVWSTELTELAKPVAIILNVGTTLDASKSYVVIREHEGVYERIPATYDAEAGTLTFYSDKFSEYAVASVVTATATTATVGTTATDKPDASPKTGDPSVAGTAMALLLISITAVVTLWLSGRKYRKK